MNEGIIQKVFSKSWLRYREKELLEELQQELIEEIKKELSFIDDRERRNTVRLQLLGEIWTKLIGDTE